MFYEIMKYGHLARDINAIKWMKPEESENLTKMTNHEHQIS